MISKEDRNKLVVAKKAEAINRRHHGKIYIKEDPAEYAGSIVTIPSVNSGGAVSFSFTHELIDDTPGRPVSVARRGTIGGAVNGFADLDDKLKGKETRSVNTSNKQESIQARVVRKLDKVIEDPTDQAVDEFFASLIG